MAYTLDELRSMDDYFVTADMIAPIVGADPQALRIIARDEPWRLGFPSTTYGSIVKFPRLPFIDFVESGDQWYRHIAAAIREAVETAMKAKSLEGD